MATPEQPGVEYVIRKFVDVVEEELHGCRPLIDHCHARWRDQLLPGSVDRSRIDCNGRYHYGDYRFSLDREEVLRLFPGEKLYGNQYVFIRELLQNAIDACRLNVYLNDADPGSMEVRITAWEDDAGYYWFRVDDTGVGMDQEIVEKYFLGVGRSYYNSDDLKAEIYHKNRPDRKFVSISRFGIGALSSFIVGDQVEVSTRRRMPNGRLSKPLRLSLSSLDDFFIMYVRPMSPTPFPARGPVESEYREKVGTSVAVRINPARADVSLEKLLERARDYLFFPPVRVYVNGVEEVDGRYEELGRPLIPHVIRRRIEPRDECAGRFNFSSLLDLTLVGVPLDVTEHSPVANVRGQLVALAVQDSGKGQKRSLVDALPDELRARVPGEIARELDVRVEVNVGISWDPSMRLRISEKITCEEGSYRLLRDWLQSEGASECVEMLNQSHNSENGHIDIDGLDAREVRLSDLVGESVAQRISGKWLGHNGICTPVVMDSDFFGHFNLVEPGSLVIAGLVCVYDELRPEVSVSRETMRGLSFDARSAIQLAVRRAASIHVGSSDDDLAKRIMGYSLFSSSVGEAPPAGEIMSTPLFAAWCAERIFRSEPGEWVSIDELRERAPTFVDLFSGGWRGIENFYNALRLAMAENMLNLENARDDSGGYRVRVRDTGVPVRPQGARLLSPHLVLPYETDAVIGTFGQPANLAHPLVFWFSENAEMLKRDLPSVFMQVMSCFEKLVHAFRYRFQYSEEYAQEAVELINRALERTRRWLPEVPDVLMVEVRYDSDAKALVSGRRMAR